MRALDGIEGLVLAMSLLATLPAARWKAAASLAPGARVDFVELVAYTWLSKEDRQAVEQLLSEQRY